MDEQTGSVAIEVGSLRMLPGDGTDRDRRVVAVSLSANDASALVLVG
jgi:hypothetical protein